MTEGELPGVQHLTRKISGAFSAVNFIAEHGMPEVMEMDANLVGAASVDRAFEQAAIEARTQNAIFGFRGTARALRDAHPLTMNRMTRDGRVDCAEGFPRRPSDEREINFSGCAIGKLF